ncbi:MAG: M14 family zinc carboxypeptidase [Bacteroidales bacterium]
MRRSSLLFAIFAFVMLTVNVLHAQTVVQMIEKRGEAVVEIPTSDYEQLNILSRVTTIEKISEKSVLAYLNRTQYEKAIELGFRPELHQPYYNNLRAITMAATTAEMANWDKYPTWSVYQDMMLDYAAAYPDICYLDTIGFSVEGRAILVLKISDNPQTDEDEPEFFLSGQMHGDELIGYMLPLRMIDYLLTNYGSNAQVDSLVDNLEIWINPLSNPDGTYGNDENDVSQATRYNADGVDLNRNFPDPGGNDHPDGNPTAVENLAMMDFASERHFVMSANTHSGAEVVNYPWDTWETLHADNDWWYDISRAYADKVHEQNSDYMTLQDNGITNGYQWYSIDGSRQDYMNYFQNCRETTLEWSNQKLLDAEDLPDHWLYNRDALLDYFAEARKGIHGIITDSVTGEPLEAEIRIQEHDFHNSFVTSALPAGDYHRPLAPGTWELSFSKEGYQTKTLAFNLEQDETIIQNVQLVSLDILPPDADFFVRDTLAECSGEVNFSNLTEGAGEMFYLWDFGDGTTSTEENPVHRYYENGTYTVSLEVSNENGSDTEIKNEYLYLDLSEFDSLHNATLCENSGVMTLQAFSDGDVYWYENQTDETAIASGNTYTTPVLTESHTYFAEAEFPGETGLLGEPDNSEGGSYNNDGAVHYLVFDCYQTGIINSVKVYAGSSGDRIISLQDNAGNVLESQNISIAEGEQTINLDFVVYPGNDYRLAANADCDLLQGETGWMSSFDYPYEWADIMSIKDSDSGSGWSGSESFYPYFYNWEVSTPDCYSERVPVFAALNEAPQADFEPLHDGLLVDFDNNSLFAETYAWDFGDGNSSVETNPQHAYDSVGEYTVQLTAYNACGSNQYSEEIVVSQSSVNPADFADLKVYPNPASDFLQVSVPAEWEGAALAFYNASGKQVFAGKLHSLEMKINVSDLQAGLHLLRISKTNKSIHRKIVIH